MSKRFGALGSIHNKVKHPHKTKKRLAIKAQMLAKAAKNGGSFKPTAKRPTPVNTLPYCLPL